MCKKVASETLSNSVELQSSPSFSQIEDFSSTQKVLKSVKSSSRQRDIIFDKRQVYRRKNDKIKEKIVCLFPGCGKCYVQFPTLHSHIEKDHSGFSQFSHQKPQKQRKVKKGRPQVIQKQNEKEVISKIEVELLDEKLSILEYFENQVFCKVVHSLMLSKGYLSKEQEEFCDFEELSLQQINDTFCELAQVFNYEKPKLSEKFLRIFEFLSTIVIDQSFILIAFCLFTDKKISDFIDICISRWNSDMRFSVLLKIIEKDTELSYKDIVIIEKNEIQNIDEIKTSKFELFMEYFTGLRTSLNNLWQAYKEK